MPPYASSMKEAMLLTGTDRTTAFAQVLERKPVTNGHGPITTTAAVPPTSQILRKPKTATVEVCDSIKVQKYGKGGG